MSSKNLRIEERLVGEVEALANDAGESVSGWVNNALEDVVKMCRGERVLPRAVIAALGEKDQKYLAKRWILDDPVVSGIELNEARYTRPKTQK